MILLISHYTKIFPKKFSVLNTCFKSKFILNPELLDFPKSFYVQSSGKYLTFETDDIQTIWQVKPSKCLGVTDKYIIRRQLFSLVVELYIVHGKLIRSYPTKES